MQHDTYTPLWEINSGQHWQEREEEIEARQRRIERAKRAPGKDDEWGNDGTDNRGSLSSD